MVKAATLSALVLGIGLGVTSALAQKTIKTDEFSGWMEDYEMLTFDEQRNAFIFEIGAADAGPGVLRARSAITGVKRFKEGLRAYHLLPVAAVFRGARQASGSVDTYIDTRFEGEIVDSVTGDRVVAIVAKGIEDTSKRSGDELVFEDVIPTLDKWLAQLEGNLQRNLAAR